MIQMIPHHQAAIDMCQNLLKYTTNISLQNIALDIISEQTQSIQNMRNILNQCLKINNSPSDLQKYQRQLHIIQKRMFHLMQHAAVSNNINLDFIHEMIPHHQGAIQMSRLTLEYEICPQLRPILQAIIVSQEKGVKQMKHLLEMIQQS